jgi:DNA-3-methyladenine glycosylase
MAFEKNAQIVARNLLGKYLVRRVNGKTRAYKIVETEAYVGPHDKASHSYGGRRTKRNEPMWGKAGHWYVYFTYGMHYMLNLVTGKGGYPSAVLIRAIKPALSRNSDYSSILQNTAIRKGKNIKKNKLDGPGKLTKALKIDKKLNGKPANRASGLWIENRPAILFRGKAKAGKGEKKSKIIRTPRIGINYAEEWKDKPLRFVLEE